MSGSAYYMRLSELESVVGATDAAKLVLALGGGRIYVPEHPPAEHAIVVAIGPLAAQKLASHLATGIGGMLVELPTGAACGFASYRSRLRALASDPSKTEAQIARELSVHGRTVRRMRAKLRAESGGPGQVSGERRS